MRMWAGGVESSERKNEIETPTDALQSRRATTIAAANVPTRPARVDGAAGLGSELLFVESLAPTVPFPAVALPLVELPAFAGPDEELSVELFA
ncbi:hypothetical protein, partial [Haladaptatus sp. W1]|uniref:hypothetical protein n=1 Tax=Haladaptatus sp. W1 TaxID=1897478 RepID=UPI001586AE93